jgi:hypothetical protein
MHPILLPVVIARMKHPLPMPDYSYLRPDAFFTNLPKKLKKKMMINKISHIKQPF